jgi:hypothetical protein
MIIFDRLSVVGKFISRLNLREINFPTTVAMIDIDRL